MLGAVALDHSSAIRGREPARERRLPDAAVLLSIRPDYVELISGGVKRVEFRRRPFARDVARIVIYATGPVKKLVGFCEAEKLVEDTPAARWARYGPGSRTVPRGPVPVLERR